MSKTTRRLIVILAVLAGAIALAADATMNDFTLPTVEVFALMPRLDMSDFNSSSSTGGRTHTGVGSAIRR